MQPAEADVLILVPAVGAAALVALAAGRLSHHVEFKVLTSTTIARLVHDTCVGVEPRGAAEAPARHRGRYEAFALEMRAAADALKYRLSKARAGRRGARLHRLAATAKVAHLLLSTIFSRERQSIPLNLSHNHEIDYECEVQTWIGPMHALEFKGQKLEAVVFNRLQALAARGYRPVLKTMGADGSHAGMSFTHPRFDAKKKPAPKITLWSDGLVATSALLWPERHVPSDEPAPDWQRYIMPEDEKRFNGFLESVAPPGIADLYVRPFLIEARLFAVRFTFGATLCALIAFSIKLAIGLL